MSDLTRSIERHAKTFKTPELPEWWRLFQVVAGIGLAVIIVVKLMAGSPSPTAASSTLGPVDTVLPGSIGGGPVVQPATTTAPTTTGVSPATSPQAVPAGTSPVTAGTVEVATASGAAVRVPKEAASRASAVALAQNGGGTARVERLLLLSQTPPSPEPPTKLLFNVEINPDPGSGAPLRYQTVQLVRSSDGWVAG